MPCRIEKWKKMINDKKISHKSMHWIDTLEAMILTENFAKTTIRTGGKLRPKISRLNRTGRAVAQPRKKTLVHFPVKVCPGSSQIFTSYWTQFCVETSGYLNIVTTMFPLQTSQSTTGAASAISGFSGYNCDLLASYNNTMVALIDVSPCDVYPTPAIISKFNLVICLKQEEKFRSKNQQIPYLPKQTHRALNF